MIASIVDESAALLLCECQVIILFFVFLFSFLFFDRQSDLLQFVASARGGSH